MATVIEFFLQLVAMEWILVVFLRIQSQWKDMYAKVSDRTWQLVVYRSLSKNLRWMAFTTLFYFVTDGSFYSWRRSIVTEGRCKDNTSKDPFSQWKQLQGIHMKVKSQFNGTLTTTEIIDTNAQYNKRNNMFNVDANLKHVNTHDYTNWRLVSAFCLFWSVSKCRRLIPYTSHFGSSVSSLCFIHHVLCTRCVTLSSTSPSTSHSLHHL